MQARHLDQFQDLSGSSFQMFTSGKFLYNHDKASMTSRNKALLPQPMDTVTSPRFVQPERPPLDFSKDLNDDLSGICQALHRCPTQSAGCRREQPRSKFNQQLCKMHSLRTLPTLPPRGKRAIGAPALGLGFANHLRVVP